MGIPGGLVRGGVQVRCDAPTGTDARSAASRRIGASAMGPHGVVESVLGAHGRVMSVVADEDQKILRGRSSESLARGPRVRVNTQTHCVEWPRMDQPFSSHQFEVKR